MDARIANLCCGHAACQREVARLIADRPEPQGATAMHDHIATVHVGIVIEDPAAYPASELLDHVGGMTVVGDATVTVMGDGFTEWGEPREDGDQSPVHAFVVIGRPTDADGDPTDVTPHGYTMGARRVYADRARAAVLNVLPSGRYRLADYVAVDLSPVWGEDSAVVGLWA